MIRLPSGIDHEFLGWLGFCLSVSFVLFVVLWSSAPQQDPSNNQQTGAISQANPAEPPAATPADDVGQADRGRQPAKQNQSELGQFARQFKTDPLAWLTLVLAFIAVIQSGIFWNQLASQHRIERAYVHVEGLDGFRNYGPQTHGEVVVVVGNSGSTPARITAISLGLIVVRGGSRGAPPIPDDHIQSIDADFIVASHAKADWGGTLEPASPEQWAAVMKAEAVPVVFGRVDYRDVFERDHFSKFGFMCREFSLDEMIRDRTGESTGTWVIVPGYNESA